MTSAAEQNQPTVAQEYAYDQINRTSKEIRVLTLHSGTHDEEIRCSVSVVSLIDNPKYEALSYVWGDHQDKRMIYVNGCQTEITSNLDTALRYIRYEHEDRKLWIDALCINQGDDLEKTHQVSLMAEIFKMSTSAILWLGCSYKSTKDNTTKGLLPNTSVHEFENGDPFAFFRFLADDRHIHELPCFSYDGKSGRHLIDINSEFIPKLAAHWDELSASQWWTRIWTVQEVILPKQAMMQYGHWTIPWSAMESAAKLSDNHEWGCCKEVWRALLYQTKSNLVLLLQAIEVIALTRHASNNNQLRTLRHTTWMHGYRYSSDPRDKIYALLALYNIQEIYDILPDYALTDREVFINAFRAMIMSSHDGLVVMIGSEFGTSYPSLPSWVPDFTRKYVPIQSRRDVDRANASQCYKAAKDYQALNRFPQDDIMQQSGIFVKRIKLVSDSEYGNSFLVALRIIRGWWSLTKEYMAQHESLGAQSSLQAFGRTRRWWKRTKRYMAKDKSLNNQPLVQAFGRTIASDVISIRGQGVFRRLHASEYTIIQEFLEMPPDERISPHLRTYDRSIETSWIQTTADRKFFITEDGHLGTGPWNAQPGDEVWVLYGGDVPFLLRPIQNAPIQHSFRFLGDCYLHGFMDGEAISGSQDPPVTISLI